MNTIICNQCGIEIEINAAMQGQIEQQVLESARKAHAAELDKMKAEAETMARQARESAQEMARKQFAGAKELMEEQAKAELDLAKQRL